jgi:hypothetical protein
MCRSAPEEFFRTPPFSAHPARRGREVCTVRQDRTGQIFFNIFTTTGKWRRDKGIGEPTCRRMSLAHCFCRVLSVDFKLPRVEDP